MLNLPLRDLEALSAYLDGALDGPNTARLQTRLAGEPQLSAALRQLEQTRGWLRSAPRRKLPRSFALSPATAAELRPAKNAFAGWSLLSATASLLLVAVLATSLLPGGQVITAAHEDAAPQAFMLEMAPSAPEEAAGSAAPADEPMPGLAIETEEDALRSDSVMEAPADYTPSREQLLGGLALLAAGSGLMAWRQWRRLPDR